MPPHSRYAFLTAYLRASRATCSSCGYPLRALTAHSCPECGSPIRLHEIILQAARPKPLFPVRAAAFALSLACAAGAALAAAVAR